MTPAAPAARPGQAARGGARDLLYMILFDMLSPERGSKFWLLVGSPSQLIWSCARKVMKFGLRGRLYEFDPVLGSARAIAKRDLMSLSFRE